MRRLSVLALSLLYILSSSLHIKGDRDIESTVSDFVASLSAETFYQRGGKSNGDQAMPQCGNQCKLKRSPYEGEPDQLLGSCGCMATHQACSAEFSGGIVKELCHLMGNREFATAFTGSSAEESAAAGGARRLHNSKDSSLVATAECWQASQNLKAGCEVLFEEASRPLLHALRKAQSKNIRFSHCALSFGDEAPLQSERCFTSNATDSAGAPFFAVGRVFSVGPAGASTPLTFSAHYDNHWDFTTHELVFVIRSSGAEAASL